MLLVYFVIAFVWEATKYLTPARTHSIRGLKFLSLEINISNDGETWSFIFHFEILPAPSELLLPSAKNWIGLANYSNSEGAQII